MSDRMPKQMVELYCHGVLPPESQRRVEAAFDEDPQVQAWFLELGELPEHVHAERDQQLTDMILDHFAEYRGALANPHDRALEQLEDCLLDDQASEEVKENIRTRRYVAAEMVTVSERVPLEVSRAAVDLCMSARSHDIASDRSPFAWYIDEKKRLLVLRLPATTVDEVYSHVRFGVVLIEVCDGDDIVARHLLPVARGNHAYGNSAPLAEILGELPFSSQLKFNIVLSSKELLQRVSVNQVDAALQTPYVAGRADLRAKLETLRDALSKSTMKDEPKN